MESAVATALRDDPSKLRRLLEASEDLLAIIGEDGYARELNPAWENVLGWTREELVARPLVELVHPGDLARTMSTKSSERVVQFENRYRCKNGTYKTLRWSARKHEEDWYAVARTVNDLPDGIDTRRDPLTGLPERIGLVEHLRATRDGGAPCSLALVDIDGFSAVNDLFGTAGGDELLRASAERLRAVAGDDLLARTGADQFVVVGCRTIDDSSAGRWARDLLRVFSSFHLRGDQVEVRATVGIARGLDAGDPEAMVRDAELAVRRARSHRGLQWAIFDERMRDERDQRLELRHALDRGELALHYQPIVSLRGEGVLGAEALMRWRRPGRPVTMPGEFIALAEAGGQIAPMGRWALGEACRQAVAWERHGGPPSVWVNLSPRQLEDPALAGMITGLLERLGLPGEMLHLELTESALVDELAEIAPALESIRQAGVRVAIDDFGTGSTSLAHLRELPVDVIKIDRSFVSSIEDTGTQAIISGVLALAERLGVGVVAEGVEHPEQDRRLRELGCPAAQGFLYQRPVPALDLAHAGGAGEPDPQEDLAQA